MGALSSVFHIILYQPIFNALVLIYNYLPDFGMAIIALTLIIRAVLYFPTLKSIKAQKSMQDLQPKIKEVQEKFKNNKEQQGKAMMELYKEEKINPLSGCLPMLIQLPILIALFLVLKNLASDFTAANGDILYSFVARPGEINPMFLGLLDLTKASAVIAVLAGASQFVQLRMTSARNKQKGKDFSGMMQKQMLYFFPIFAILILLKLPSAIGLYWLTSTLFSIGQQYLAFRPCLPIKK